MKGSNNTSNLTRKRFNILFQWSVYESMDRRGCPKMAQWLNGKGFQEECELFKGTRLRKRKIQPCDFGYLLSHLYILYSRAILKRRKYFSLVSAEKIMWQGPEDGGSCRFKRNGCKNHGKAHLTT